MSGERWFNHPKADYKRDRPRRDWFTPTLILLYVLAAIGGTYILLTPK